MTYLKSWEEFEKIAENLYLQNSLNVRFIMKYDHAKSSLLVKLTDNSACIQYKAEMSHEMKKIEKFMFKILNHMVSKEV